MVRWDSPVYCIIECLEIVIYPSHSKQYAAQCQIINTVEVIWNEMHQMLFHIWQTCPSMQILWWWINFITIHRQTTSPHLVNTSWRGHYHSVHPEFTHINQTCGEKNNASFYTANYNNYIKKCKIKISITFHHFSDFLTVMLHKILQYSSGQFFGIQTTNEQGSSIPHEHTNQTFKLSFRLFLLVFSVWGHYPPPCICTKKNNFFFNPHHLLFVSCSGNG